MSDLETKLRAIFDIPEPSISPEKRIQHLGAFWPSWNLHKRKCDVTGKDIVSIFRSECPYPVWHKDEWFKNAKPPQTAFDFEKPFFQQAEALFKQCPIAHNIGTNNENCEFTDDWWYSRNCYLCHNGIECDNCRYLGARVVKMKDCMYCVSSQKLERCIDCVNCDQCFEIIVGLSLKNCREMAFSYDCRNCSKCLFCFNLRNKEYCIGNQQFTKESYEIECTKYEYATVAGYQRCFDLFKKMMCEIAWHRAVISDLCDNSSGNYIDHCKNCENTFFYSNGEDICNTARGLDGKSLLDTVCSPLDEYVCNSCAVQVHCFQVRCSFQLTEARFVDYSAYSAQIENCFGCCGLVRAKNCILNTLYSIEEYSSLKKKIIDHMKSTGEWGKFFPGSFAPNPYDESWSSFYFPLTPEQQQVQGFYYLPNPEKRESSHLDSNSLPKTPKDADESTIQNVYWDDIAGRPFQILPQDINFCRELGIPLPNTYYMRRLQENFRWMPYSGALRTTKCAKSGKEIQTSWPSEYDGRILSEEEYLKIVI